MDGLIVSNSTISRPDSLLSPHQTEIGGLSGAPLRKLALETLKDMYRLTKGQKISSPSSIHLSVPTVPFFCLTVLMRSCFSACHLSAYLLSSLHVHEADFSNLFLLSLGEIPIIGLGGIGTGLDAYERIRNGASVVQIYTAFAHDGPPVVRRINRELDELLKRDGFKSVQEAVGVDISQPTSTARNNTARTTVEPRGQQWNPLYE